MNHTHPYVKSIIGSLCNQIKYGRDLTRSDLQAIIVLLQGESDETVIIDHYEGHTESIETSDNITGYEAIRTGGRPEKDSFYLREIAIYEDFVVLRETHKYEEVLEILANESLERFGKSISSDRIKTCVSNGKYNLSQLEQYHSSPEFNELAEYHASRKTE